MRRSGVLFFIYFLFVNAAHLHYIDWYFSKSDGVRRLTEKRIALIIKKYPFLYEYYFFTSKSVFFYLVWPQPNEFLQFLNFWQPWAWSFLQVVYAKRVNIFRQILKLYLECEVRSLSFWPTWDLTHWWILYKY